MERSVEKYLMYPENGLRQNDNLAKELSIFSNLADIKHGFLIVDSFLYHLTYYSDVVSTFDLRSVVMSLHTHFSQIE